MLACRVLGHRYRFAADGRTMRWWCERGCDAGGSKEYATPEEARMYARGLDREDKHDVGRRPLLSLLPLWAGRRASRYRRRSD
ncbi:MAG: hypothetical protein QOE65_182 [Solirubrobacteraceae bacterium]|jgi:hypothetical protein|nr:hypothetical protein [Solirubrobacteraceae bacterium]